MVLKGSTSRLLMTASLLFACCAAKGAIECELIPNGSFTSSDDGWVFDTTESFVGGSSGSLTISLFDGTSYMSPGGDSLFDEHVLAFQLVVEAGLAGIPGAASVSGSAATTVPAAERFLRFERGGGFEFLFFGATVHDLNATVTVENARGESATSIVYQSVPSEPTAACDFGLSILGTFDGDPSLVYLDLESAGIEIGEDVTITISVSGSASTLAGCQASQVFALLLVDDFSFCDGSPCEGDLDFSGEIGFGDLLLLLSDWGTCPFCPSDLTSDGEVGFADLLLLLDAWGPCN